ncbi:hypothetical protein H4W23_40240 [Streptomyces gardneri]|uniref:hypothetical protein n=1 Tax=Streptomyces gardneri TaxID=66892 RepID=UPI0006E2139F|nr:hypothetical protein [Streptomyces gardneri]QPK50197.1 hypothetical protein H4W23_40240 [Streptomyces gardneri]WRK41802.1 hypothetical protein U0M97_40490 [Streptomyces venezuelae]
MAEYEDRAAADGDAELDALLDAADRGVLSSLEDAMEFSRGLAAITGRETDIVQEPRSTAPGSAGGGHRPPHRQGKRQRLHEATTFFGDVVHMSDDVTISHHHTSPTAEPSAELLSALIQQVEELRAHAPVEDAEAIGDVLNGLALARESRGEAQLRRALMAAAGVAAMQGARGAQVLDLVRALLSQFGA